MKRNVPLAPGGPLVRTSGLRSSPIAAGFTASRTAGAGRKTAATGRGGGNSGPTPKVRWLVLERDGYRCTCGCGQSIIGRRYSLGHRLRASQGGRPVPSNLLTFLGWGGEGCHGRIDSRRDPADEANGMTVRSWQDPAQIPVMITCEDGSRVSAWLWDDGQYHFDGPQEAAAA